MTVKEIAEKNPGTILNMMTPCGYLTILADDLLKTEKVDTNPGAPGPELSMSIEASEVLDMKVVDYYPVEPEKNQYGKKEICMLTDN